MVRQLAAHAAAAGILLHPLQPVEHDQVRTPVAQAAFEPFQTPARRAFVLAEEELVALAQEGVGVGLLVERPDQHVRLAGLHVPATTRSTTAVLPVPPAATSDHTRSGEARSATQAVSSVTSASRPWKWGAGWSAWTMRISPRLRAGGAVRGVCFARTCQRDGDLSPRSSGRRERVAHERRAQPGLEGEQRLDARRDLRHACRVCEHGGVGEKVLLLLLGPRVVVRDDPHEHVLAGRLRRFHLAPRDAAPTLLGERIRTGAPRCTPRRRSRAPCVRTPPPARRAAGRTAPSPRLPARAAGSCRRPPGGRRPGRRQKDLSHNLKHPNVSSPWLVGGVLQAASCSWSLS